MNSSELIAALAINLQLSKTEVARLLEDLSITTTAELKANTTISLSGFGNFEVKKRNERISINPTTGTRMLIPPKLVVKFKPSGSVKTKLKEGGTDDED